MEETELLARVLLVALGTDGSEFDFEGARFEDCLEPEPDLIPMIDPGVIGLFEGAVGGGIIILPERSIGLGVLAAPSEGLASIRVLLSKVDAKAEIEV